MENSPNSFTSQYIIIAIVAFLVGFGSAWIYFTKKSSIVPDKNKTAEQIILDEETQAGIQINKGTGTSSRANSIMVSDQSAGTDVSVSEAVFENIGWVVIHEDDGTGKPGKILGAQLFDAGVGKGSVKLLRGTLSDKTYYAMLHTDNGDRAFDPKIDLPLKDGNGNFVMTSFKTAGE